MQNWIYVLRQIHESKYCDYKKFRYLIDPGFFPHKKAIEYCQQRKDGSEQKYLPVIFKIKLLEIHFAFMPSEWKQEPRKDEQYHRVEHDEKKSGKSPNSNFLEFKCDPPL